MKNEAEMKENGDVERNEVNAEGERREWRSTSTNNEDTAQTQQSERADIM